MEPYSAQLPAVVSILSLDAMLSLTRKGIPATDLASSTFGVELGRDLHNIGVELQYRASHLC